MAAITAMAVSAVATGAQMYGANKAKQRAHNAALVQKQEMAKLKLARQEIVNPYEGITNLSDLAADVSGMASNPFANLSVSTAAAEMQIEQADIALANTLDTLRATGASAGGATALARMALESKKGVAASIQQQEANNQQLAARGEERLQNVKMDEATRIQGVKLTQEEKVQEAEAKGIGYMQELKNSRNEADLNRAAGLLGQAEQNKQAAATASANAFSAGVSSIAQTAVSGGVFKKKNG